MEQINQTQQTQVKRDIAVKTRIKNILEGRYVKEEGWKPNFIITPNGENIARANLIGVVVSEPNIEEKSQSITIDDGSDRILLRSFEDNALLSKLNLGDVINVIGKPREYLNMKYLIPEIIKKINNNKWLEVRKKELGLKEKELGKNKPVNENIQNNTPIEENIVEEETDTDKILKTIKDLDKGGGVFIEDIIGKTNNPDTEKIITSLMEQGEIFEVQPGKIKILE
ncbi:hypothetical protein KY345_01670 [Candidatus Woesearchaeota archaeon]|nr:hypothetical protein [Candidatus Woesearchaeota archaeon]